MSIAMLATNEHEFTRMESTDLAANEHEHTRTGTTEFDAFMAAEEAKDLLRISTAGSVDDGKSTLIGRLLHDARGAYEDQLRSVRRENGLIDFALLTDGLRAEREQGITIDVAYRYFATPKRKFILADTPGHVQYTRNMATGASTAHLAIILADAERGLTPQSMRHASIAALLGIRHFVIAVNKMDLVNFDRDVYDRIRAEFSPVLESLGVMEPYFLPMSALLGDNVVEPSSNMPWFAGPPLLEHLENTIAPVPDLRSPFRMPVQRVIRPDRTFRGYAGQIASGIVRPGDEVVAMDSGLRTRIASISTYDGDLEEAYSPMSVTITLQDEIDISRGDMLASTGTLAGGTACPTSSKTIDATAVWFDRQELDSSRDYLIKHTTQTVGARVEVEGSLSMNDIGKVRINAARPLFYDSYKENRITGSFILIDKQSNATVAGGMIL
jgi:sulfate adenylyltransferase large subunit